MHGLEMQRFAMDLRRLTVALKCPCEHGGVVLVVAERFAIWRLMFLAEMRAGRFVALEGVNAHQLCKFEKIGDASGAFQRLVVIFFAAGDAHVVPELLPQFGDFSERFPQSLFAPRHSAFVPEKKAEFPM